MTRLGLLCSASIVSICLSSPALADLTAAEAWEDWLDYFALQGYDVSGTETRAGDTLTISDFVIELDVETSEMPVGTVSFKVPELVFTEIEDGSVEIGMSSRSKFVFESTDDLPEPVDLTLTYATDDLEMRMEGVPGDTTYFFDADAITLSLDELSIDDAPPPVSVSFVMVLNDVKGRSEMTDEDTSGALFQAFGADSLQGQMRFQSDEAGVDVDVNMRLDALSSEGAIVLPEGVSTIDTLEALKAGFAFDGDFEISGSQFGVNAQTPQGPFSLDMAGASTRAEFSMSLEDGLTYAAERGAVELNASTLFLPVPISVAMASTIFDVKMPFMTGESQNFGLAFEVNELSMADALWDLFDPGQQLSRDPASIQLGVEGRGTYFVDIFDPEAIAELEESGGLPGELETLTLTNLLVEAAGAALTGGGDFEFDNSELEETGVPKAIGAIDLKLVGGNGLLDSLVAAGLLPEEQALGARMMLGLFARPGDGEDTLTSNIEFNEEGHILANGQRIQ